MSPSRGIRATQATPLLSGLVGGAAFRPLQWAPAWTENWAQRQTENDKNKEPEDSKSVKNVLLGSVSLHSSKGRISIVPCNQQALKDNLLSE